MNRNRLHNSRLSSFRIDRVVNYLHGILREGHRDISLHKQVYGPEFLLGIVGVNEELLEPLQLRIEIIETECHTRVVLVGNEQAITFGDVNLADLETGLHEAARAQAEQFERGLRFK